ncbi:MAG: PilZ domain-containing protein [Nitrospira sp.]|nr:PilZ domain-containing protein [Nitrospira sp.]MDP1757031.1 PilZ domain-containing protein [Pseudohongiella sp.]
MTLHPVPKTPGFFNSPMAERRGINRIPLSFGLMYSGSNETDVIMGNGTVVDMSRGGLGVRGNQPVTVDMGLTLFLSLPDKKDPPFVIQAQVAWVHEHRFGLKPPHSPGTSEHRIQRFLHTIFHTTRTGGKA